MKTFDEIVDELFLQKEIKEFRDEYRSCWEV